MFVFLGKALSSIRLSEPEEVSTHVVSNLTCTGSETALSSCQYDIALSAGHPKTDVANVYCYDERRNRKFFNVILFSITGSVMVEICMCITDTQGTHIEVVVAKHT